MKKAKPQQTAQEKAELEKDINLVRETPYTEEQTEQAPKEVSPLLTVAARCSWTHVMDIYCVPNVALYDTVAVSTARKVSERCMPLV